MSYLSPALTLLVSAVKKTGQSLTRDFNEIEKIQSSVRGSTDFARSAVVRAEKILRQELSKARPAYPFAVDGEVEPQGPHFVVSAMDGMTNFIHGVPCFAVSAAIVDNSTPLMAVIYNPATDELFFAEKGCGAYKEGFRNHERLRVSARKDLSDSLIGINGGSADVAEFQKVYTNLLHAQTSVRLSGSLAMDFAYVSAGKLDAVVGLQSSHSQIIPALLLVKEAGGLVRDINTKDIRIENLSELMGSGNVMAINPNLSTALHGVFKK